jgi:hypothetical protein
VTYTGRITKDEVMDLYEELRKSRHPLVQQAEQVQRVFDGEVVLPIAQLDQIDVPAVANLTFQGVDAIGQRIGSQVPNNVFPILSTTGTARETARTKRSAVDYWWKESSLPRKLFQLGRWFAAYGATGVLVQPGVKKECPQYVPLDPLRTYPSGYDICCEFAITVSRQTRRWCAKNYPDASGLLWSREAKPSDVIELIEYVDDYEFVILARTTSDVLNRYAARNTEVVLLNRFKNISERCPVFMAGRPGLTGPKSQFAGVLGTYVQRAMLSAYNLIGVRKAVMPEKWAFSTNAGETPSIIEMADSVDGTVGIIANGQIIQMLPQPSTLVPMTEDRLERNERATARIPAEMGGEAASNVRTDRRGQTIFSATVDLPVREAHDHFAEMLTEANKAAIAVDKAYYGGQTRTLYVAVGGIDRKSDYDPDSLWDTDRHEVVYSQPGADTNGLSIELGQRIGMDLMSRTEGREMDPFCKDPERTNDLIQSTRRCRHHAGRAAAAQLQQGAAARRSTGPGSCSGSSRTAPSWKTRSSPSRRKPRSARPPRHRPSPRKPSRAWPNRAPGRKRPSHPHREALGNLGQLLQSLPMRG